ncbi:MAG: YbjN domain-containing protein [Paracoccus sp. (in: a-proteobacteria)]|jgi:hypothetical protein|uniref:YbjN domain-containing protein n=1 Tax=unclassified Paracoccus (in: a-proteobacteria) TaxID=2688777 RepID=UPI000C427A89|nr:MULTISPECIES: YbjN domain-containing protein [unclassified Paracoccus (in: a-proteobacteria)]MAN56069.1 YbjN domain-containing protein [Paracoccus sp. (in: a-proteobacteria)]MBA47610.1 YbjN domain-containing protein [Paracoccus sp. (in: a-proteobacteria)]MCS5603738.1 YbjN domain-containing protein [Paracoccus sp. (in: a-proteobacteria)]|tara:strand:+ start:2220 stop:2672 length:453 start_codon:yes stop_codon:yes gene_type:complete
MRRIPAATFACLIALPAAAQVKADAGQIQNILQDRGMTVIRGKDDYGAPRLTTSADGNKFSIYFYDCDPGPCDSVQFVAGFSEGAPADMAAINAWNREFRFGRVYLDDAGNPFVAMDVMLSGTGIGKRTFADILDNWGSMLADFRNYMNW